MEQSITASLISELQAIEIAESVVEGTVVEMELDKEDGRFIYELIIEKNNGKVEVAINAFTGDILKK